MRNARLYLRAGIIAGFFILLALFVFYQTKEIRAGGAVIIIEPRDGETVFEPIVRVRGTARKIAFMKLNGREIYSDENGAFEESLLLSPGYTIITLTAEDVFGHTQKAQVRVVFIPRATSTAMNAATST